MFRSASALFIVFLITLAIGVAGSFLSQIAAPTVSEVGQEASVGSGQTTEETFTSKGLKPCRNVDGVTLVRGDVIKVGEGRLKAYFALSNEGPMPIYFFSDTQRELTDLAEYDGQIHEIKPYELEWVLLPIPENDQPFKTTISYRQGEFRGERWFTASFTRTSKFPDACL